MNQKNLKILTNWENQTFFVKKLLKTWKNDEKGEIYFQFFLFFLYKTQMMPICKISFRFFKKRRQMYLN